MQIHDPAASAPRRAIVLSPDRHLVAELEPLLLQKLTGFPLSLIERYPSCRNVATQVGAGPVQLVFLDVASSPDQALELLPELTALPNTQVLALLPGNDPAAILRCLRAGAVDFLLRPFTADQLDAALAKIARLTPGELLAEEGRAKVISVMPAKGACGATTLACNLAFHFKRLGAERVLLADLDPLAGTVSFLLKLRSSFSFLDVLQRGHELDDDLWRATVTSAGGVDVLLAPEMSASGLPEDLDATPILNYARHAYDVVVADAGSVYGEWNLSQARCATELLLVTTNELPALQAAQRALTYLEANRIPKSKTRLVVNRYQRDVGLSREVIGTALHTEVYETVPSDYDAVQKALMEGKAVPSTSSFGKAVAQLAARMGGPAGARPAARKSAGGLAGLLGGLFSKTKK
jgi:pilus assembly protein CpaE